MRWVGLTALSLVIVGCTGSSTPATTPTSVATTSSTTTTIANTTTVDRLTEIEAIFQGLEERRFMALYEGDREAFRDLHVDNGYLERSMVLFDELIFDLPPRVDVEVLRVIHDGPECIAFERIIHRLDLQASGEPSIEVLEIENGAWLISFSGSGWACEGSHPFDS
jgi:hypothetical protein